VHEALSAKGVTDSQTTPQTLLRISVFMVPVVVLFFGLTGSCTEFLSERLLLRHESPLRIPARIYFVSKLLVLLAWTAVEVSLFLAASLAILGIDDGLAWVWGLSYATCCVGVARWSPPRRASTGPCCGSRRTRSSARRTCRPPSAACPT